MFLKMIFRVGTILPLLVGSAATIGSSIILELILPTTPAIAQTTFNTNLLIPVTGKETYGILVARAEANAEVKVQELFDKDLLRTEVRLTVLGQNGAAIAPILKLRVSRQEWASYPDPEIWSIYYPESQILLNFLERPTSEPEPEPEKIVPIIEETQPTETFITPTGETLFNDESTPEPVDSAPMMEEENMETNPEMTTPEDSTTENMDDSSTTENMDDSSTTESTDGNTIREMQINEGMGSSRNNTIRPRRSTSQPAQ